jgi:hypothetical protein
MYPSVGRNDFTSTQDMSGEIQVDYNPNYVPPKKNE